MLAFQLLLFTLLLFCPCPPPDPLCLARFARSACRVHVLLSQDSLRANLLIHGLMGSLGWLGGTDTYPHLIGLGCSYSVVPPFLATQSSYNPDMLSSTLTALLAGNTAGSRPYKTT